MVSKDNLTTESVKGASLALECVHNIKSSDSLPTGMLGVGNSITDHVLKETLEHLTGLVIDASADALHTTTTAKTADGGLGDTLDVILHDLAVALGAALAKALSSFSTSRHFN
jgi:hypothetical protein